MVSAVCFAKLYLKKVGQQNKTILVQSTKSELSPFGDIRQELVFIGQNLNKEAVIQALDDCLLSAEEVLTGITFWATLSDPFPAWDNND